MALAILFMGLVATVGFEEAKARAMGGGLATSGGGGSAVTIVPWTITNNTAGAMTNVPIECGLPLVDGYLPSGSAIQLYDADGVTLIPCQEDNHATNVNSVRKFTKLTAVLPSLGASTSRQLTIKYLTSTSVLSGTSITTSDVIATGYDCTLTMAHKNGTTYTASAATAIAAGAWSAKTAAANQGKWRLGPVGDEWVVFCPFKNGGTAAPNNLGAWICISAFKAATGVVNGGNPIIGIMSKYRISCGYVQETLTNAVDHYFDLTVASGSTTQSWVGSSPAFSLTIADNTNNTGSTTATSSGGTPFSANSLGQVISDGTGTALIIGYTSPTVVTVRLSYAFASGTTTSGNWRIYGLSHSYASNLPVQEIWYNGSPTITAKPDIDSRLGVAWNVGANTGGPFSYFVSTGMVMDYKATAASITNSMTPLTNCGTNPCGTTSIQAGNITMNMPETGSREDIAPLPGWDVRAMIKADSNSMTIINGNAAKADLCPWYYTDQNTGKTMMLNNGTDYYYNLAASGTKLPTTNNPNASGGGPTRYSITSWYPQIAHHPSLFYTHYLHTGDFFDLDNHEKMLFYIWCDADTGQWGTQLNRLSCNTSEARGNAWSHRDAGLGSLLHPDRDPSPLGFTKAHITTWWTNQFTATNSGTADVAPRPGLTIGNVNNTGPGKAYPTNGIRGFGQSLGGTWYPQWQVGYNGMAFGMLKGAGQLINDSEDFYEWFMEALIDACTTTDMSPNWFIPVPYPQTEIPLGSGNYYYDWTHVYQATANDPTANGQNCRLVSGSVTLSALSGSSISAPMPTGYFSSGGTAFYNGMVKDLKSASLQIAPVAGGVFWADRTTGNFQSVPIPTNNGYCSVRNTGSVTMYAKLSVGSSTANSGDTAITAGSTHIFTVGANTYVSVYAASSNPMAVIGGSSGSGYAVGNTITCTFTDTTNFTVVTRAVLTVATIGAGGEVTSVTVSTPGLYTRNSLPNRLDKGGCGLDITQFSTSGSGTGATFTCTRKFRSIFDDASIPGVQFGVGKITNVATDTLTLDTTPGLYFQSTLTEREYLFPFAQVGMTSGYIMVPAPANGDNQGATTSGFSSSQPQPFNSTNEYWDIFSNAVKVASVYGLSNAAAANTYLAGAYTGTSEVRWGVR